LIFNRASFIKRSTAASTWCGVLHSARDTDAVFSEGQ
jgi:hypothetical protein